VSRIPFVLASERYFPRGLTKIWSTNATPGRSIIVCCAVFTVLLPLGFVSLVVLDVFFYMGALVLEMAALIRLRRHYPRRDGLFMIRGGRPALIATAAGPIMTWFATFGLAVAHGDGKADFAIAIALAASAWPAYALLRWRYGGPDGPP